MEELSEQQEIKDIITSREDGFGHRLKIARNERNLSTADVARQLRLDEKIILALESEEHQRLPVSAFVCGYIRNYAKLLHVQPEPLIDCYKKGISDDSLDPELKITKGKPEGTGFDISKIMVPIVLVLVTTALAFGGWKLWDYISTGNLTADNSTPSGEISESVVEMATNPSDAPDALLLPALDEPYDTSSKGEVTDSKQKLSAPDTTSESAEVAVVETSNSLSSVDSIDVDSAIPAEGSLPTQEAPATGPAAQASSNVTEMALPSPGAESVAENSNYLVLEFSGNSWVVIKDAENKQLATGLKKAGQTLRLKGKPPYNLFLGDGRVVKVTLHGKIYDHSQYINDKNIARFNVE